MWSLRCFLFCQKAPKDKIHKHLVEKMFMSATSHQMVFSSFILPFLNDDLGCIDGCLWRRLLLVPLVWLKALGEFSTEMYFSLQARVLKEVQADGNGCHQSVCRNCCLLKSKRCGICHKMTLVLAEQWPCDSHQQSDAEQPERRRCGSGRLGPAERQPGGCPQQRDHLAVLPALPVGGRRLHPGLPTHLPAVHGGEYAGLPHRNREPPHAHRYQPLHF